MISMDAWNGRGRNGRIKEEDGRMDENNGIQWDSRWPCKEERATDAPPRREGPEVDIPG